MQIWIEVFSIVCAIAGAFTVGAAGIQAPSLLQLPEFKRGHKTVLKEIAKARRTGYDHYPEADREEAFAAAEAQDQKDMEALNKKIDNAYYADRRATRKWVVIGTALVVVGLVTQPLARIFLS